MRLSELGQVEEDRWKRRLELRTNVLVFRPGDRAGSARHVLCIALCPESLTATRVECVSRRLDVDTVPLSRGFEWLSLFSAIGWPMFSLNAQYDGGERWRPGLFTCVGTVKRLLPEIPWWILTPTQLLRYCMAKGV